MAELLRIYDFQNGGRPPSWTFMFSQYLTKIQICDYFSVDLHNLVKIGQLRAELLGISYFRNGGRPPCWIWYDVIADLPRLVFHGPNIVLKLHVDREYTLQDIAIFTFGPFWLEIAYSFAFWGNPKGPSFGENTSCEP